MLSKEQVAVLRRSRAKSRNRIAKAMTLAGVTQVQMQAATGFTQGYISRIKNGRYTDLPGETMRTLATFFGCQIEDLFPARDEALAS